MLIYGESKIIQVDGAAGLDKTVSELTGLELMWSFYSYSKAFALTIGFLEITGGILLVIK